MDEEETELEYCPIHRLYELFSGAVRQASAESEVTTSDILAAIGLVAGEVAEMHIEMTDEEDDDEDSDD